MRTKPTGAYARRIWHLYETFTGTRLDLLDTTQGNYVDLADPQSDYAGVLERSSRHRVNMNLLGTPAFSPSPPAKRRFTSSLPSPTTSQRSWRFSPTPPAASSAPS